MVSFRSCTYRLSDVAISQNLVLPQIFSSDKNFCSNNCLLNWRGARIYSITLCDSCQSRGTKDTSAYLQLSRQRTFCELAKLSSNTPSIHAPLLAASIERLRGLTRDAGDDICLVCAQAEQGESAREGAYLRDESVTSRPIEKPMTCLWPP